ncbi:uncharacterized protein PAC_10938 [Phialocephala subalpina]|uniref:Uncharacterized protein n=1 Tax=Phialocephala subalpina TaxID=576137 RepID=A0A1L7X7P7_9HELO|nr:uncharacterized protein PAC_10938 [Phialocephala subalpina]
MPAPGQFLPRKSSAHRIACIALYRALLKQCPHIPIPDDIPLRGKTGPIKHLIQKAFRKNVYLTGPRVIVPALESGYAVHSLLHHASLSPANAPNPSLAQVHTLLRTLSQEYQAARIACPPKPPPRRPCITPYPGAPKLVDIRPLPKEKLTGRRHVPKLVGVHSVFPFLRFKKPQSPYLSRILRNKVKKKHLRYERIDEMDELVAMGELEDGWDKILEHYDQVDSSKEGRKDQSLELEVDEEEQKWKPDPKLDPSLEWEVDEQAGEDEWKPGPYWYDSWTSAAKRAINDTWKANNREGKKAKKLGEKMAEIIEQEKNLAEEERRERRHLKNMEKIEKKIKEGTIEKLEKVAEQQKPLGVRKDEIVGQTRQEKVEEKIKVMTEKLGNSAGRGKQLRITRIGTPEERLGKSPLGITGAGRPGEKPDKSAARGKSQAHQKWKAGGRASF